MKRPLVTVHLPIDFGLFTSIITEVAHRHPNNVSFRSDTMEPLGGGDPEEIFLVEIEVADGAPC